jgi:uncharacterized protein YkwD
MPHPIAPFPRRLGPALAAVACLAAGGAAAQDLAQHALEQVNAARSAQGLVPARLDPGLSEAAGAHAEDMLARGYFDHVSPEGTTVQDRLSGGWRLVAENIAMCTGCTADAARVEEFHAGWMESAGHRANILAEGVTAFGFGLAVEADTV